MGDLNIDEPLLVFHTTWLFICSKCGFRFEVLPLGDEKAVPIFPCLNCGEEVKGSF